MSTYGAKKLLPHCAVPVPPGVVAVSSLVIVPIADPSAIVAPDAFDNVTVNVSVGSTAVSPSTAMVITCEVTPGANVIVPEAAV